MESFMIKHDGELAISIGKDRQEKRWKNKTMLWSELIDTLRETTRTRETIADYLKATRMRQTEIKDVGGFVAGYINGGRRKSGSITSRSALTLDLDFATSDFWDVFTMIYSNAALMYSTHKHTPDSPRLRLILPLNREVFADEYVAIARQVAGSLGIDAFDDTTFQPERLMYWPSTATDGEYLFEVQDGDWIDADEVLATYRDWKDASQWPVSSRVREAIHKGSKKQGDPLEKIGVIGAFCREYTIHDVIETFLADRYEVTDTDPNRYTYQHGSTAGGLVVYEDKFAYSHHGTDPTSGKLVNAFDLCRIHLFGSKDEDSREGTAPSKLPSFTEMENFALADKAVRKRMSLEKIEAVKADFADTLNAEDVESGDNEELDMEWLGELQRNKRGECEATINNALLILRNDPQLKGVFALNKFDLREIATRHLPWRKINDRTKFLKDSDDAGLRHYMEHKYEMRSRQAIQDALAMIVEENAFHPILDYFKPLEWDGVERIDTLLIDYLGCADTPYHRLTIRKTLIGAVARIYRPGCKFDNVLTLVGEQGVGKSTFISRLGRQWYSDSFNSVKGKEAFESLQGVWLMEMGELAGLKKAEVNEVKHFITKGEDRYRVAYGRRTENFPRQCIFFGTTNNRDFLQDATGNRRFWPVDVGTRKASRNIWEQLTEDEIGQIWAEAIEYYRSGETLILPADIEEEAKRVQADHQEVDERTAMVMQYLATPIPDNWVDLGTWERREYLMGDKHEGQPRTKVCAMEIWVECFGNKQSELDRFKSQEIHRIMKMLKGWEAAVVKTYYGTHRGYKIRLQSL